MGQLSFLLCLSYLAPRFFDDRLAKGLSDVLFYQPVADDRATLLGFLGAFALEHLAGLVCAQSPSRFRSPENFVRADLALAGIDLVRLRGLIDFYETAEQGWTAFESLRQLAKAGAGLVDCADGTGAIKIVEVTPLLLEIGDGCRGIGVAWRLHRDDFFFRMTGSIIIFDLPQVCDVGTWPGYFGG